GTPPPVVPNPVTDYVPSGWPGVRAPHVWLRDDGETKTSTIDLVGKGFLLLTGTKGAAWADAARGLEIEPGVVGTGAYASAAPQWRETYGIEEAGAVLVRPDGHIGWRSAGTAANPARVLGDAMNAIHGKA